MKSVSGWLYRVSTWRVALALVAIFVLFSMLVLPGAMTRARENSHGAGSPDMSLYYSAGDLYRMAEAHGQAGRDAYVRERWTADLAFPLVYGAALAAAISWLFARVIAAKSAWRLANVTPVLVVIIDFLENISTSLVMLRYPAHTPIVDSLAGVFTFFKWLSLAAAIVLLLVGLGKWVAARRSR